jgi:hypothetical protein
MKLLSVIVEGRKRQTDGRRRPRGDRLLRDMDRLVDASSRTEIWKDGVWIRPEPQPPLARGLKAI